jgi:hypothetical protein
LLHPYLYQETGLHIYIYLHKYIYVFQEMSWFGANAQLNMASDSWPASCRRPETWAPILQDSQQASETRCDQGPRWWFKYRVDWVDSGRWGFHPIKTGISRARNGFRSIKGQDIWQTAGERKIGANKHEMGMQL